MEENRRAYVDSNIFINVFLGDQELSKKSEKILEIIKDGKIIGFTSLLTYDEIFWKVKRMRSREQAIQACSILLGFQNLRFVEVTQEIISLAHKLLQKYELGPRDAIHAASAINENCVMLSFDKDFKKVKELKY